MQAELVSLSSKGKLRVTYNWLYSALNCDPNDNSTFLWNINSLGGNNVSLSPQAGYRNMTLYASVRDDCGWQVEVQAPYSADWIRAVGRDEIIGMQTHDLGILGFKGFNASSIAVDASTTTHNDSNGNSHTGYVLHSLSKDPTSKDTLWFPKISGSRRAAAQPVDLDKILKTFNITLKEDEYKRLLGQIS
jgi:hypothetical protein